MNEVESQPQPPSIPVMADTNSLTRTLPGLGSGPATLPKPSLELQRLRGPEAGARFQPGVLLKSDDQGAIYEVKDLDLDRSVAVKTSAVHDEHAAVHEARILARLHHPGIPPLYDLERTVDGRLCSIMPLMVSQALDERLPGTRERDSLRELVLIIREVLDALAHAHARGIVHLDVKPEHIRIQGHSGVVLSGWSSARMLTASDPVAGMVGTPLYMAPEMARAEPASIAADIYGCGATLFHMLIGRPPVRAADEETFWLRKRAGNVDLPTADEQRDLPPALIAIAIHALAAEPSMRYRSAAAMARDLDAFVAGATVSVYGDTAWTKMRTWYRKHAVAVLIAAFMVAASLLIGWKSYGERLRLLATWGRPVLTLDFNGGTGLPDQLRVLTGAFEVRDGALVSTGERDCSAIFVQRCEGPVAVEYDARILPGSVPCDVSVLYALDPPDVNIDNPRRYYLQIGARDNSYAQILNPERKVVTFSPLRLESGRTYHVRMEIEGAAMRIIVDGALVCEHREIMPIDSGWLGLYAYYPGKSFDKIQVYSKGMPEVMSPLALGDQHCRDGRWQQGAAWFARVAEVHQGKELGEEASFRAGLALQHLGRLAEAEEAWRPIAQGRWRSRIAISGLENQLASQRFKMEDIEHLRGPGRPPDAGALRSGGVYALVAARLAELYPQADVELRLRMEALWNAAVFRAGGPDEADPNALTDLLAVRERLFPDRCASGAASALLALRRYDELLTRFSEHVVPAAEALMRLGRAEEVLVRFADHRFQVGEALLDMGRIDEIRAMQPSSPTLLDKYTMHCETDLTRFSRADVLNNFNAFRKEAEPGNALVHTACLIDRVDEAMQACAAIPNKKPEALVISAYLLADADEALLRRYPSWIAARAVVDYHRAITGFMAGEPVRLGSIRDPGQDWYSEIQLWMAHLILRPFIAEVAGEQGAFARGLKAVTVGHRWHFMQRPRYCAEYILGGMDDAQFLAQPYHGNAAPLLVLCKALRAEHQGDAVAARAAYADFLALPPHLRCLHEWWRDPVVERFAAWRFQALAP